jgi:hypothetical protein
MFRRSDDALDDSIVERRCVEHELLDVRNPQAGHE